MEIELPRLAVFFGPNATGKSNILDAIQALSRVVTSRTLSEALADPIRGYPIESFEFPTGGLPELLGMEKAEFSLEADLQVRESIYRYRVAVGINPASGKLGVEDEYLAELDKKNQSKGHPRIEKAEDVLRIRRKSKPAHPKEEKTGGNHTILSDARFSGEEYRAMERCRQELAGWRTYYLDPRMAMRSARSPSDVQDIGVLGEDIAPFLYKLKNIKPKAFKSIERTLRALIPSIESLMVDLDTRRGVLDIQIRQHGCDFSSRIISEGTLRVLALCSIVANPWDSSLTAFEEPENGVHPKRLELIAKMLCSLAEQSERQIVVTSHSPICCDAILRQAYVKPDDIHLFVVSRDGRATRVAPLNVKSPLFDKGTEIDEGLASHAEDGTFEHLMLRGYLDE